MLFERESGVSGARRAGFPSPTVTEIRPETLPYRSDQSSADSRLADIFKFDLATAERAVLGPFDASTPAAPQQPGCFLRNGASTENSNLEISDFFSNSSDFDLNSP